MAPRLNALLPFMIGLSTFRMRSSHPKVSAATKFGPSQQTKLLDTFDNLVQARNKKRSVQSLPRMITGLFPVE